MTSTVVEVHADRIILSVPEESRDLCPLQQGDVVELLPRPQRIRKRFAEGQLLREHLEILHELPEDRTWLDALPVGRECL